MAEHELAGLRCSDVLEASGAFVLGALSESQAAAVRAHLAACPEAHAEVAELGGVLPALFESVEPVEPPAGLKVRILEAAAGAQRTAEAQRAAETQRTVKPWAAAESMPRRGFDLGALFRRPIWAGVSAVALAAVIALGAWNIQLGNELAGLTAYRNGVVQVLASAAKDGAQLALLTAPEDPSGPSGLAAVGADGSVALVMRDLEPTSGTQVYETWLIGADGNPVPIGSFAVDASRTASFAVARTAVEPGVTVALTREPRAGAMTPTMPIVAVGAASAAS